MSERLNAFSVKTCCEDKDTIDGLVTSRSYLIFYFFSAKRKLKEQRTEKTEKPKLFDET